MSEPTVEVNITHSFGTKDACEYNVNCAVMISNLRWWILKNRANEKHYYEGRWWTYNSLSAFCKLFPYWSIDQIRTVLEKLIEGGAIVSGNFNKTKMDQTRWYAFKDERKYLGIDPEDDKKRYKDMRENAGEKETNKTKSAAENPESSSEKSQMDSGKIPNGIEKNPKPIPDNKPDINKYINIFPNGNKSISEEIDAGVPDNIKQSQTLKTDITSEINTVIEKWNKELAEPYGLPGVRKPNPDLKEKIKRRLREKDFDFDKIINRIKESDFLIGKTEKFGAHSNWSLTLDFIVRNESNYLKILFTDNYHKNKKFFSTGREINKKILEFMSNVDKHLGRLSFQEFRLKFSESYKKEYFECIRNYWGELRESDLTKSNFLKNKISKELEVL